MSATTGIEWADSSWNPATGCTKISAGCDHCYAETFAERWRGTEGHYFEQGFDVQLRPNKLTLPLNWKKPRRIFVNSMSDLFHKDIPDEFIVKVFAVMSLTPQHTYQILTKRHARMRSLLGGADFEQRVDRALLTVPEFSPPGKPWPLPKPGWPLPNCWLGVSVEDQKWADIRIPALLETPAAVRFLSCEPLLGPIDLGIDDPHRDHDSDDVHGAPHPRICLTCSDEDRQIEVEYFRRDPGGNGIGWVIVGGESGPGARPMRPDWARSLRDQCVAADVPFLFKQLGSVLARELGIPGKGSDIDRLPADLRIREYPNA